MRACFLLKVRLEKIEENKARHAHVWPEMLAALRETGWRNYSLFLCRDGLEVGYCEADDFDKCRAAMKCLAVNQRWQSEMAPLFDAPSGDSADETMIPLEEASTSIEWAVFRNATCAGLMGRLKNSQVLDAQREP